MTATLTRNEYTNQGTFGVLNINDKSFFSLELPWRENKPNISCIPIGQYKASLRYSPHFKKNLYWLQKVKSRTFILIHGATFAGDETFGYQTHLQGCMSIGKSIGTALNKHKQRQRCIFGSQQALSEFMDELGGEELILTIKDR